MLLLFMRNFIFAFLFLQIFTNALAISSVLTIALGLSVFLFGWGVKNGHHSIQFEEPVYLSLFFVVLIFGFIFVATGEKATNHLLMWCVPVLCYYYMFKRQLYSVFSLEEIKGPLFMVLTIATLFACSFAIIEFFSVNFLGNDLAFIPRGTLTEYTPTAIDRIRARSFMEESGHFSFFWELFSPISVYWINKNIKSKILRYTFFFILILGLLLSFSAYGFVCLVLWAGALLYYHLKKVNKSSELIVLVFYLIAALLLLVFLVPDLVDMIFNIIQAKLDPEDGSHADRANRLVVLDNLSFEYILTGYGPDAAGTLHTDSFVSFYLGVLMSTGLIGGIFLALFFIRQLFYVMNLKDGDLRFTFSLSLIFALMHLMFIDIIYVPWLWVFLSLLCNVYYKEIENDLTYESNSVSIV
jgi:hypothetical protein